MTKGKCCVAAAPAGADGARFYIGARGSSICEMQRCSMQLSAKSKKLYRPVRESTTPGEKIGAFQLTNGAGVFPA
jgi:hypothetical protein